MSQFSKILQCHGQDRQANRYIRSFLKALPALRSKQPAVRSVLSSLIRRTGQALRLKSDCGQKTHVWAACLTFQVVIIWGPCIKFLEGPSSETLASVTPNWDNGGHLMWPAMCGGESPWYRSRLIPVDHCLSAFCLAFQDDLCGPLPITGLSCLQFEMCLRIVTLSYFSIDPWWLVSTL